MSGENIFFLFHSGETWGARGICGHFWPAYTSWFPSSWRSLCLPWVPSVLLCPRIAQAGEDYPKIRNVIQTLTGRWRRGWTMLLPRSRSPLPVCSTRLVKIATHEKLWIRESSLSVHDPTNRAGEKRVHTVVRRDANIPQRRNWVPAAGDYFSQISIEGFFLLSI